MMYPLLTTARCGALRALPLLALLTLLFLPARTAQAIPPPTTYYVATATNGGSNANLGTQALPFLTLQYALDQCRDGDTVSVGPGTYTGAGDTDLDFGGIGVTLISQNGAAATTIDCGGTSVSNHRAFTFHSGETAATIVQGFTIQNAYEADPIQIIGGAVIITNDSSPTFSNCVFQNNQVVSPGTFAGGGAVGVFIPTTAVGDNPTFTNCVFTGNSASGSTYSRGGAVYIETDLPGSAAFTNCTFTGNSISGTYLDGAGICSLNPYSLTVTNCILSGDTGAEEFDSEGPTTVTYSDVQGGYTGTGNFDADPLFIGATDLHLQAASPCIDAGTTGPGIPATDIEGRVRDAAPDLGAYEATTNAQLTGQPVLITATEGTPFTGQSVATFTDTNPNAQAADFSSPTIDWGDGSSTSTGSIVLTSSDSTGSHFEITGDHTYDEAGTFAITVSGVANQFTTLPDIASTATILDAPISATGMDITATALTPFTGVTATFIDANPVGRISDFTATIDWGDGTQSLGTITQSLGPIMHPNRPPTSFLVTGTHTYALPGMDTVTTFINDVGGSTAVASSTATVSAADTVTTLNSSVNPTVFGQPVTFTAAVTSSGQPVTQGSVTFTDTTTAATLGTVSVDLNGQVAFSTDALAVGTHDVTATYADSASPILYNGSSAGPVTQTVSQAATTTTLTSSLNPATDNDDVTFTATVTANAPGGGVPTGTVQFAVNGINAGAPVALDGSGTASYSIGKSVPGSYTVTATYSGDASFAGSGGPLTQTVTPGPTTHFAIAAPHTATAGMAVSVTITALDAQNLTATGYAGTVHITSSDAHAVLPADTTLTNGEGQFTITFKTAGAQTVTATDTVTSSLTGTTGTINVGAATSGLIAFVQPPTDTVAGASITPAPSVKVTDTFGNPVAGASVTLSLAAGTGTLGGTLTRTTGADGVATFSGLTLSRPGQKTLQAAAGAKLTVAAVPFTVTANDSLTATGVAVQALRGASFTGPTATFTDTNTTSPASDFTASIDWGDGTAPSVGTITGTNGKFTVAGTHTYTQEGADTVKVTVTDLQSGGPVAHASAPATVTSPAVVAVGGKTITATVGQSSGAQIVATFTDPAGAEAATSYSATIAWGDGTASSSGTITAGANGLFTVTGAHTYAHAGTDSITVTVHHASAPDAAPVTSTAQVGTGVLHTFPAGLQLFSVPKDYSGVSLGTALSQSNPRLAVWMPSLLQYVLSPSAPADALRPGQGYWARFGGATALYDLGTPTPTDAPFAIALSRGWNMIGDPFPTAVALSAVSVSASGKTYPTPTAANAAGLVAYMLYSYPAGATQYQTEDLTGTLAPYAGYWVYAFQPCTLQVSAPQ